MNAKPFSVYIPHDHDADGDVIIECADMREAVREAQNWQHVTHAVCRNSVPMYWNAPYRMGY